MSKHTERSAGAPVFSVVTILMGIVLTFLAIPIVMSDLLLQPGNLVIKRLQNEEKVSEWELQSLVDTRKASAKWRDVKKTHMDISLGYLILENYLNKDGDDNLQQAERSLIKALTLAPMSPYGWMRLAQVRNMLDAPASQIAGPLKLALKSGQNEDRRHFMLLLMVETGLEVWDELNDQEREIIANKTQKAWERDPRRTATLATRMGRSELLARILEL